MNVHRLAVIATVVALVASAGYLVFRPDPVCTARIYFERAVNLHPGDDVRILGVRVGEVTEVAPEGNLVRVMIEYDARQHVPERAGAVIVAPSLASGRFVQLTPAYTAGAVLADGASIPRERTSVPVEWDQVKEQLTTLADALGPDGANRDGALGKAVDTAAAALSGQGGTLRKTITDLSAATATLSAGRKDLFTTVRDLGVFVNALNASDKQMREFASQVSAISSLLADNRTRLSAALSAVDTALETITRFLHDNGTRISTTVRSMSDVAKVLGDDREQLAAILHSAPTALANTYDTYDGNANAFASRLVINQTQDLAGFTCSLVFSLGGTPDQCRSALAPLLNLMNVPTVPVAANLSSGSAHDLPGLLLGGAR